MISREEKYIYEWETRRSKGKWSYIILTTLIWGTFTPFMYTAFKLAFRGLLHPQRLWYALWSSDFVYTWFYFMAGFFLYALLMWHLARRKYYQYRQRQKAGKRQFCETFSDKRETDTGAH